MRPPSGGLFMYRKYGMSRCHGWQRATHVQEVRYVAVPWMAKSDACTGSTGRYLLLGNCSCVALISYVHVTMQYLHFHHPWWSYVAVPWMAKSDACTGSTGRYLLLGNCSCVALINYIHVTMHYLITLHPCR